jgi:ribosomal protein S18 acetylase RimI-like enzyme
MAPVTASIVAIERVAELSATDLHDLCEAADAAIIEGGGFGWLKPPPRPVLENYWRGVLLIPERSLFIGRLDGTIAGSAQLARAPRNNEAQSFAASITTSFVAPWARGHGMARQLTEAVEGAARGMGMKVLNLDLRETQSAAIKLYENLGFVRWGEHPHYALVERRFIQGYFYYKDLTREA